MESMPSMVRAEKAAKGKGHTHQAQRGTNPASLRRKRTNAWKLGRQKRRNVGDRDIEQGNQNSSLVNPRYLGQLVHQDRHEDAVYSLANGSK